MKEPTLNACCKKYPECHCSNIASKVAQKMHDLRLQEIAHDNGVACKEDDCEDCCEHDEVEDGFCLNCGGDRTEWMMCDAYDRCKPSNRD